MPGEKEKSAPKVIVIKDSCTPPAAMGECLMSISFHLMNSCSHQKRSRSPRNSWSHKAVVPEQVQSGVTPQCQRSSSSAIPVGLEQREAEQRDWAQDKPRGSPGPVLSSEQTLMQQLGWVLFRSCSKSFGTPLNFPVNKDKLNLSSHRTLVTGMQFPKALLHSHSGVRIS